MLNPNFKTESRILNVDFLRATAITLVVFYHVVNMTKVPQWFWQIAEMLTMRVVLFFILSGYLVGGLYFRELERFGNIDVKRFIGRRLLRTVPIYWLLMLVAYIGTSMSKSVVFDWTYLVFLQNYRLEMPFYVVSWSLCVEEHFYIILPFCLPFLLDKHQQLRIYLAIFLFILPLVFRLLNYDSLTYQIPFGYHFVATHLRCEGLIAGVVVAYYHHINHSIFDRIARYRHTIFVSTVLVIFSYAVVSNYIKYCFSFTLMSIMLSLTLICFSKMGPLSIATKKIVSTLALISYSVFLSHSLVIHTCVKLFERVHLQSPFLTVPLMMLACFGCGFLLYQTVEKPIIDWRNKVLPSRKNKAIQVDLKSVVKAKLTKRDPSV